MAIGQVSTFPFSVPSGNGNSGTNTKAQKDDKLAQELAQVNKDAQAAQDAFAKRIELVTLKAKNDEIIKNLQKQQDEAERARREFERTRDAKGSGRVDTGEKGFWRWVSNAGTAIWNIGKSFVGFDKNGKWDPIKCVKNVAIAAAAIGATFIPYVGPVI